MELAFVFSVTYWLVLIYWKLCGIHTTLKERR